MSTDKHYIIAANKTFFLVKYPKFTHFDNVTKQEYGYWTFNEKKRLTDIPFKKYVESNDYVNYTDRYPTFWSVYALDYNLKDEIVWKRETDAYDCRCVSNKFNSRKGSCLFNSLHSFFCHDGMLDLQKSEAIDKNPDITKEELYDMEMNLLARHQSFRIYIDFKNRKAWSFLTKKLGLVSDNLWRRFMVGKAELVVQEIDYDLLETTLSDVTPEDLDEDIKNGIGFNYRKY